MGMANQMLTTEVEAVLRRAAVTGNKLVVPFNPDGSPLERSLYEAVNKALLTAGGKWDRTAKAHVFPSDPLPALGIMLATGVAVDHAGNHKKAMQAFYTPDPVADVVANLANVRGQHVFEPSAGRGALVTACLRAGAERVSCVELDPESTPYLYELSGVVWIAETDFLTLPVARQFDRIVMNPPFARGSDIEHVAQAMKWLAPGGTLVSIMSAAIQRPKLVALLGDLEHDFIPVEAGAFKESGTNIATVILRLTV